MPPRRVVLLAAGGHEAAPSRPLKDQASSALPGLPGRRTLIITAKALIAFPLGHWRAPRRHSVQSTLDLSASASGHQRARVRRVCVQAYACGVRVRVRVLAHPSGGPTGFRPRQGLRRSHSQCRTLADRTPMGGAAAQRAERTQIARRMAAQRRSRQIARRSHAPPAEGGAAAQRARSQIARSPAEAAQRRRRHADHRGAAPRDAAAVFMPPEEGVFSHSSRAPRQASDARPGLSG